VTSKLVKCPHCGYQYRTDVKKIVEDGKTIVLRIALPDINKMFRNTVRNISIDLTCPNCTNEFEWQVKT